MADKLALELTGDGTPEAIAYKLMHDVLKVENRAIPAGSAPRPVAQAAQAPMDRYFLLNTYHECLLTVQGKRIAASRQAA